MLWEEIARPSRSGIWSRCPGSAALMREVPDPESGPAADDGTRCHEIAADMLNKGIPHTVYKPEEAELFKHALRYAETVTDMASGAETTGVEMPVEIWSGNGYTYLGTVDFFALMPVEDPSGDPVYELQVHDLKSGRIEVRAEGNTQLISYAWGVYRYLTEILGYEGIKHIRLVIHMPVYNSVDECTMSFTELLDASRKLNDEYCAARDCFDGKVDAQDCLNFGDHCYYCPVFAVCGEPQRAISQVITEDEELSDAAVKAATKGVDALQAQAVAEKYGYVKLITKWCSEISTKAYSILEAGEDLPGYKMVAGKKGARFWADEEEFLKLAKRKKLKKAQYTTEALKSPAQLEKIIGDKLADFTELIEQKGGKPTIAPVEDKRPALEMKKTDDMFENVDDEENPFI